MADARALTLVLLVALAGCNGALGPLDDGSVKTGGDEPPFPPGVTGDGVNATALFSAHVDSLDNESFTLDFEIDATSTQTDAVATIGPGRERAAVRIESPERTKAYFFADGVQYEFSARDGETSYRVVNRSDVDFAPFVHRYVSPDELRILFATGTWAATSTTECDAGTCWVLEATGVNESAPITDATAFDGRAVVAPSGRVANISATLERPDDSGDVDISITRVGTTDVTRPAWVDEANESGTRIGFDQRPAPEPEPKTQRIEREFDGQNGSVAVLGAHEDADYGDLETRPVGVAPDNPLVDATVGWFVSLDFTASYEDAIVELGYNETRVPDDAAESELGLYRLNYTTNRYERLDATLDPATDSMTATVGNVTGIYAVFHAPTFEALQNETTAASMSAESASTEARVGWN